MDRSASGRRPLVDMSWSLERCVVVRLSIITPPLRRHLLPACQQPRQPPPPPVPPQTSTSAPKDGGRRYTAHTSMLGSCFWSPPAMPDAVQPRQQQIRTVQAGLLRPQRPQRALGLCGLSGPWLPVPRGTQAFHPSSAMDATEGPRASTHCWILATRLDMQPGGYFMSRLDKMWDEGDMHAA